MQKLVNFARFQRLLVARNQGHDEAAIVEDAIARELVGQDVLARDVDTRVSAHSEHAGLRPFEAAEVLSMALDEHLMFKDRGKYDPKFAKARTVEDLWRLRQTIDSFDMDYGTYVDEAFEFAGKPKGRAPRLSQLMHPHIAGRVASKWIRKL